jgi:D-glycero-alpha-D-manno-heptose-7-phosphate kinase
MIISRTPFRISFFGGGTDYPAWYMKHGGAVLGTSIDKFCYLTCRYLPPFFEHRFRIVYSKIENCHALHEITHPAVRCVLQYLHIQRGLEIHHDGDLPARSGMGSSSAFTVGLLHALYALQGKMPGKRQLATESIHIEQNLLGETVGSQDQILASYGGFNQIEFMPDGDFTIRPITLSPERFRELNAHLMLFYTGIKRTASNIAGSYASDLEGRKSQLLVLKDLVDESISILRGSEDLTAFGKLLHLAWQAKRSLSSIVSTPEVEDFYAAARQAGALGGKLTGAGGGGFLLLFAPPEKHQAIRERLDRLIHVPFKFEQGGSQIIFYDTEQDYAAQDLGRSRQTIDPFHEREAIDTHDRQL